MSNDLPDIKSEFHVNKKSGQRHVIQGFAAQRIDLPEGEFVNVSNIFGKQFHAAPEPGEDLMIEFSFDGVNPMTEISHMNLNPGFHVGIAQPYYANHGITWRTNFLAPFVRWTQTGTLVPKVELIGSSSPLNLDDNQGGIIQETAVVTLDGVPTFNPSIQFQDVPYNPFVRRCLVHMASLHVDQEFEITHGGYEDEPFPPDDGWEMHRGIIVMNPSALTLTAGEGSTATNEVDLGAWGGTVVVKNMTGSASAITAYIHRIF